VNKVLDIMQLPSVDSQPGVRPAGASLEPSPGTRVVPVPPVNPPQQVREPGVISNISEEALQQAKASEAVFRSVQDPVQRSPDAERPENDWTIKRPQPQKVEDPPPEPISKRMLEFLRSMWRASGSVVEMSQPQDQFQNAPLNQNNPQATPGVLAKEELTYTPSKIKKNEKL
jgi:hypothetical protein